MKSPCSPPAELDKWPDLKAAYIQECVRLVPGCCGKQSPYVTLARKYLERAMARQASRR